MPLINYHSVLTLNSVLSSELLSFGFSLKEILTLLRHYIANQKMIPENIVTNAIKKDFKELLKDLYYEVKENKVSTNSFQFE